MRKRRWYSMLLLAAVCCGFCVNARAAALRASSQFSVLVAPDTLISSEISLTMEAGEAVEVIASYSPTWAEVEFGLIAPDGRFYHFSGTHGTVRQTMEVTERGTYTFAIANNSDSEITVNGFVSY